MTECVLLSCVVYYVLHCRLESKPCLKLGDVTSLNVTEINVRHDILYTMWNALHNDVCEGGRERGREGGREYVYTADTPCSSLGRSGKERGPQ